MYFFITFRFLEFEFIIFAKLISNINIFRFFLFKSHLFFS